MSYHGSGPVEPYLLSKYTRQPSGETQVGLSLADVSSSFTGTGVPHGSLVVARRAIQISAYPLLGARSEPKYIVSAWEVTTTFCAPATAPLHMSNSPICLGGANPPSAARLATYAS